MMGGQHVLHHYKLFFGIAVMTPQTKQCAANFIVHFAG
jgi:hypothetical protein